MFKFDWDRDDCEGSRFDVARGIILSALFGAAFWLFIVWDICGPPNLYAYRSQPGIG